MMVCDENGRPLTAGLQAPTVCDQAKQVAQSIANEMGKRVWLYYEGNEPGGVDERYEGSEFEPEVAGE